MSKSFTDVYTYFVLFFIFAAFMWAILSLGGVLTSRASEGNINMTPTTLTYINQIKNNPNFNLTDYQTNKKQQQDGVVYKTNSSEGTPKDFSIEYFESKERASGFENKLKRVYTMPSTILVLVGFPKSEFKGFIDTLFWFMGFAIALGIYWMFRGVKGG